MTPPVGNSSSRKATGGRPPTSDGTKKAKRRATSVPGQYRGYTLQGDRLLVQLLRSSPGQAVSLEVLGDVAVETAAGPLLSEEAKRQALTSHPLRDSSVDVWKTLRNWVDAAAQGTIAPNETLFRLYSSRPIASPLLRRFAAAQTREDAFRALDEVRTRFGVAIAGNGSVHMGDTVAATLRPHLEAMFRAPPGVVATIIVQFDIEEGSGVPSEDLRRELAAHIGIPRDSSEQVLEYLIGWVQSRISDCIDRGQPARIEREAFKNAVESAVRLSDQSRVLRSVAVKLTSMQEQEHLQSSIYVEQLGIVGLGYDEQLRAITEYIQAEASRTEWSERGDVFERDFDEFESDLVAAWRARKNQGEILHRNHADEERGALLYWECSQYRTKLGRFDVPLYFCPGSFHKLADRPIDGPRVGWHPHYRKVLRRVLRLAQRGDQSHPQRVLPSGAAATKKPRSKRAK
jgi:hypothetical protein